MAQKAKFKSAAPYQDDILALPVTDIDQAAAWYATSFGMTEVERRDQPVPTVILERDGTRIGFAINGGDAENDGAAILVEDIQEARHELTKNGVAAGDIKDEEHDGKKRKVFFVIAPDGLCYYFHQQISD